MSQPLVNSRTVSDGPILLERRIAYTSNDQEEYIGYAPSGSETSALVWTVNKFTYNGDLLMTRSQVVHKVAWDNRETSF